MKSITLILLILYCGKANAQGAFAGTVFKSLVGREYHEEKELNELTGFISRGGTLLSDVNDPEKFAGTWFSNGPTVVALFETINDDGTRKILDVLEI